MLILPQIRDMRITFAFWQADRRLFLAQVTLAITDNLLAVHHRGYFDLRARAVIVNSGNANACTGDKGAFDAAAMTEYAGRAIEYDPKRVLVASTGIIGHFLPMDKVQKGIVEAGKLLGSSQEHANLFADSILTTDTRRKVASAQFKANKQEVSVAGVCKGSGMIGPRLAPPSARECGSPPAPRGP